MKFLEEQDIACLKAGYSFDGEKEAFVCPVCGESFDAEEIFCVEGRYLTARRAAARHCENRHGGPLAALLESGSKYLAFTENQRELLELFASGLSDAAVAKRLGVTASTVRHQRFTFREKCKTARMTLAVLELVMELAEQNRESADEALIPVHGGAKMLDERYEITEAEEKKILSGVFSSLEPLKLKVFSAKEKKKVVILKRIVQEFEPGRRYTEGEVNALLKEIYFDFATLRRYLVEYGWISREKDCSAYWLN